ncbi:hypothetical protein [Bordetella sp. 2513F-2]
MTTQARIAAFLSTSALCFGLVAAPAAFASQTQASGKGSVKTHASKHKANAKATHAASPAPAAGTAAK